MDAPGALPSVCCRRCPRPLQGPHLSALSLSLCSLSEMCRRCVPEGACMAIVGQPIRGVGALPNSKEQCLDVRQYSAPGGRPSNAISQHCPQRRRNIFIFQPSCFSRYRDLHQGSVVDKSARQAQRRVIACMACANDVTQYTVKHVALRSYPMHSVATGATRMHVFQQPSKLAVLCKCK